MAKPISTSIKVTDRASAPLLNISKNLGKCISGFMRLNQVSSSAINVSAIGSCDSILNSINDNVEAIRRNMDNAANSAVDFTDDIGHANTSANSLLSTVKRVAAAYLTMQAAGAVIDTSDTLALAKQRLALTLREGETVEDLNKKIMASANSARAGYTDTLNQVSKLAMNAGKSFESTDQITKFVEQFNKLGAMGGASVYESSQAMYQLTQSMAKGKLDGDELRSVMEGMPLVAQEIAKYMETDVGTMKELAAEGLVTAEVVRNALLGSAEETDAMFKEMPMTWAQTWTVFKNNAIQAFTPVLGKINDIVNNPQVQEFVNGLVGGMYAAANVVMFLFDVVGGLFSFIYDNWGILQPILVAVLTIMGLYTGAVVTQNAVMAVSNVLKTISAIKSVAAGTATAAQAAATVGMTTAQMSLNAALYACPLTWIVLAIVAVIAVIYLVVAAINKVTGSAISATGIIFGAFAWLGAAIWNTILGVLAGIVQGAWTMFVEPFIGIIEWVLNAVNGGFDGLGGAVANLIGQIISWFLSLGKVVTTIIDAIFGTDWTSGLSSLQDEVTSWGKTETAISISRDVPGLDSFVADSRISYDDAWNAGYSLGEGIEDKVSGMFAIPEMGDFSYDFDDMGASLGNIEDNTGTVAKSVDISQEDLKYLRDIAEQEAINKFTTAKITVEMNNSNNINSNMDLDGIVDHLATRVTEAMEVVAAGAY